MMGAKFKIGDRVRCVESEMGLGKGLIGTVVESSDVCVGVDFGGDFDGHGNNGHHWNFYSPSLQLVVESPLTIRPGRFYRTRDGRKVGPMKWSANGEKWATAPGFPNDHWYTQNNQHFAGGYINTHSIRRTPDDLIAEWVDEPAAGVAGSNDRRTPKFKVGDKVKNPEVPDAGVGIIEAVKPEGGYRVNYKDTWFGVCHDTDDILVPAVGATTPSIVCLIENGQPRPSAQPHVHVTRAKAEKEAARLAAVQNGKEFGVYELVSTRREEPVYSHEWQRLAVRGQKIDAIRELRKITGLISLRSARRAVEDFLTNRQAA